MGGAVLGWRHGRPSYRSHFGPRGTADRLDLLWKRTSSLERRTTGCSAELEDLTTRGRIEVAEKIERARELGDLSENGDYHAAKDEQGHMEGRIRQLESLLENVEIIDAPAPGVVGPGAIVTIVYEGDTDDRRRALPRRPHRGAAPTTSM